MFENINLFTATVLLNAINTTSLNRCKYGLFKGFDTEFVQHEDGESLITINKRFANMNINEEALRKEGNVSSPQSDDLPSVNLHESPIPQVPPDTLGCESGYYNNLVKISPNTWGSMGIQYMNHPREQDNSLKSTENYKNQRLLFPIVNNYSSFDSYAPSLELMEQGLDNVIPGVYHKYCCSVPTIKVKQGRYDYMSNEGSTEQVSSTTSKFESQHINPQNGIKKKKRKENPETQILLKKEHKKPFLYEPELSGMRNVSEYDYETISVNNALEAGYEEFNRLYQENVALLRNSGRLIRKNKKKLSSISLEAKQIKIEHSNDPIALDTALGLMLLDFYNESDIIKAHYESTVIHRSVLSSIIADIKSVESRGGKLCEKKEIVKMLMEVLDRLIIIYKKKLKWIRDAEKIITQ